MAFTQVGKILLLVSLLGLESSGEENARSTRTLGSFFGGGNKQPQQVQQEQNVHQAQPYVGPYERPLVYQVKYYDTVVRDVNKNNIDKAGEVRQEIGQQRVYYYTTTGTGQNGVPQGYLYVNPVLGGGPGQAQAYVIGQVGDQQVLVPCPVDYVYQGQGGVTQPLVEKVVPIKPAVVQPLLQQQQVKGREQQHVVYNNQQPVRDVPSTNRPVGVPEVVYNPYGYYGNYGSSYGAYVSPYSPYASGSYQVGYNFPYNNYNQQVVSQEQQQVVVLPQSVNAQSAPVQGGVANPYVYVYRGGVGGVSIYPYVLPVSSYIRAKETGQHVEGSSSTRVSVSAQGQQLVPVQPQQQQQNKQQPADSRTSTLKE